MEPAPLRPRALYGWLAVLYVASGLPYGLVTRTVIVLYTAAKVDLGQIGLLSLAGLTWTLKFLWAPAVDRFGDRRRWAFACQVLSTIALLGMSLQPEDHVPFAAQALLFSLAFLSATQDAAVDGHAVQLIPQERVGPANAVRASAYRLAALVLAGALLVGLSDQLGWAGVWRLSAALMGALAVLTWFSPAAPSTRAKGPPLVEPLRRLAVRPGFWGLVLFAALFKAGDFGMTSMSIALRLGSGFTKPEYAYLVTPVEVGFLVVGATVGGVLTRRWGVFRALWVLGAVQALSNLGYVGAAHDGSKTAMWAASGLEQLCAGLGTAPFLALLTLSAERAHASVQYAFWTALMGLGGIAAATWSGEAVKAWGYANWFAFTFVLALPAFALLPWVKRWLAAPPAAAAA
jgi:MFS transporter, PAT family, beta-lactamase induction signal transducer AmpG